MVEREGERWEEDPMLSSVQVSKGGGDGGL